MPQPLTFQVTFSETLSFSCSFFFFFLLGPCILKRWWCIFLPGANPGFSPVSHWKKLQIFTIPSPAPHPTSYGRNFGSVGLQISWMRTERSFGVSCKDTGLGSLFLLACRKANEALSVLVWLFHCLWISVLLMAMQKAWTCWGKKPSGSLSKFT